MDTPWYTDAVIYGVDVEKYADGNGDGVGDFIGLCERISYIASLGVTCIWLLPFYGSPGRDNGYDVSDYYAINPRVGTREDFLNFLHKAGEHGIRVIIDLVANHTSNEHPWFEAARRDNESRYRDYYVWSGDPPPVEPETHNIFPGEETSVWSYDEVARAYYFHKFYSFQPDLNIANPQVRAEIERVMDYWLAFGISGFRIDAAPLMIADNGLERANPRDPHGVLREMASYVRKRRPEGLMLGEVNMGADELQDYFGEGDQLGLLFNFTLACYTFAALAEEKARPIHEAVSLLPEPPFGCAFANFLRNLDELDFSRVPTQLRDEVFERFAPDEEMRLYGRGIRRRLAPMLDGDQRRVELAFALIMSQRGAPLFVYGDEIGMGENLSLPGRNSVRTPMQWTSGKNAGFSSASATKLVEKPIDQGPFSYKSVNVEDQQADPDSLLNRIKRMITVRRQTKVFGRGRPIRIKCPHEAVFAHGFEDGTQALFLVHNLSGKAIRSQVEVAAKDTENLTDLFTEEQVLAEELESLKLEPYGYRWLLSRRQT